MVANVHHYEPVENFTCRAAVSPQIDVRGRRRARRGSGAVRANARRPASFSLRVYGWFTEGFDTLDLKEAKALLDELAA